MRMIKDKVKSLAATGAPEARRVVLPTVSADDWPEKELLKVKEWAGQMSQLACREGMSIERKMELKIKERLSINPTTTPFNSLIFSMNGFQWRF